MCEDESQGQGNGSDDFRPWNPGAVRELVSSPPTGLKRLTYSRDGIGLK